MDNAPLFSTITKGGNLNTPSEGQDPVPTIVSMKSLISITLKLSLYQPN